MTQAKNLEYDNAPIPGTPRKEVISYDITRFEKRDIYHSLYELKWRINNADRLFRHTDKYHTMIQDFWYSVEAEDQRIQFEEAESDFEARRQHYLANKERFDDAEAERAYDDRPQIYFDPERTGAYSDEATR